MPLLIKVPPSGLVALHASVSLCEQSALVFLSIMHMVPNSVVAAHILPGTSDLHSARWTIPSDISQAPSV